MPAQEADCTETSCATTGHIDLEGRRTSRDVEEVTLELSGPKAASLGHCIVVTSTELIGRNDNIHCLIFNASRAWIIQIQNRRVWTTCGRVNCHIKSDRDVLGQRD